MLPSDGYDSGFHRAYLPERKRSAQQTRSDFPPDLFLGSLVPVSYTHLDPENRMLKQVNIDNAAEADYIFSMLMGEDVGPRREFIEENATLSLIHI